MSRFYHGIGIDIFYEFGLKKVLVPVILSWYNM